MNPTETVPFGNPCGTAAAHQQSTENPSGKPGNLAAPTFDHHQAPIDWQELERFLRAIGRSCGPLVLALFPPDPSKPCIHFPCDAAAMPWQQIEAKQRSKPELALGLVMNHALQRPADWGSKPEHLNKLGNPKAWGASDSHISQSIGIWGECDGGLPIEQQQALPGMAGLPEPTLTVWTGGKSLHLYWLLEPGELLEPGRFKELQQRLAEALASASPTAGADRSIHNPARLMRVPGGIHPATGNRCSIHGGSGKRFTVAALLAMLPAPEPAPCQLPGLQQQAQLQDAIPLHELLPKELERLALAGADKGGEQGRNNSAFKLAAAAYGIAPAAAAAGLRVDGSPESLVLDFAARCRPPLEEREAMACIESARGRNPMPDAGWLERLRFHLNRPNQRPNPTLPLNGEAFIPADAPSNGSAPWGQGDTAAEQPAGPQRQQKAKPQRFAPRADTAAQWGARRMGHSRAMACFERCVEVQAQRERNSLRRRARLKKAAKDLGLSTYINHQEIAQRVLEAKARCSGEGFKPLTAEDRAAMPKPVVRWLVKGLIPANDLTILGGRPKVGKTRVAVAIVAAVLRGESFLDFPVAASAPPVLLVTDDQSAGDTADMLTALDLWNHPRLVWSEHFRLTETDLQALLDAIKANPGALVVLDSLRSIGRALQHGENDPEIGATLYDLKQAVTEAGGTLLLIHHCNKAADLVGVEALSGHTAIGGAANTVVTLHHCPNEKGLPDKTNPQRRLHSEGRSGENCDVVIDRAGRGAYRLVSTFDHWQQQLAEAKKTQKLEQLTSLQERVRDALEDSGDWMTRRQVCDAIGVAWTERGRTGEPRNVLNALHRLVELEAAESARSGTEATFRASRCGQNEGVPGVPGVPLSDTNGSQWHNAQGATLCQGAATPDGTTRHNPLCATENDCSDWVAHVAHVAPPISDPPLLPLLASAAAAPAAPAPDLHVGDLVELLHADGSRRNGWKVADVVASTIGTRFRLESGTDYRVVGPAEVRLCSGPQEAA